MKLPRVIKARIMPALMGLWSPDGIIVIDKNLKGRLLLRILIHELLHELFRDMPEKKVDEVSTAIARFLWKHGTRIQ